MPRFQPRILVAALFFFALTAFDTPRAEDSENTIAWKGCGITKKAFLQACATAYTERTGVKVKVSGGGATKGIAAAGDGSANFGGTCRGCLASLEEDKLGLSLSLVAWDALVPIVHPSNPVSSISKGDLIKVFSGEITNWIQLGGPAGPISVLVRNGKTSGVGFTFRQIVIGDTNFEFGQHATRYRSSGPLEQQVERNRSSLGMTGMSSARLRKVKTLAIDGNEPSKKNIASGAYPYYRPLFLAHKKNLSARDQAFLSFVLDEEGQKIIDSQGTVNLDVGWKLAKSFRYYVDTKIIVNYDALLAKAAEREAGEQGTK